jgi:hypothetical protein
MVLRLEDERKESGMDIAVMRAIIWDDISGQNKSAIGFLRRVCAYR